MKILKNIYSLLMIIAFSGIAICMQAQQNKGTITLEISSVTSDNPQIASMADMFKGTETVVYFKDKQSLTKMNMMGGMVKIDLKIDETQKSDMLMDAMGQKIWVETTKAEADLMKVENPNPFSEMDISYDKNDVKTVAGYQCYKMTVAFPDSEGATLEAYITEDIKINAPVIQGVEMKEFKGFPLEYNFNNGMMVMSITTTSFVDTVDESIFDINTSGFTKKTMKELMQMSGGMGGFGF